MTEPDADAATIELVARAIVKGYPVNDIDRLRARAAIVALQNAGWRPPDPLADPNRSWGTQEDVVAYFEEHPNG